jgi:hypothetical protein
LNLEPAAYEPLDSLYLGSGPVGGGDQSPYCAEQDQAFDMSGPLMQLVEYLPAGIIGGNRIHVAADGCARRVHAGNDGELRIGSEHQHQHHQNALRDDAAVMCAAQHHGGQKDQPAEHAYPVKAYQRAADDETGGVYPLLAKQAWQFSKRKGGEHGAKEDEGAQPDAERKVHQRVEERSH